MPYALLLAMQAAGMITDYFGTQNQSRLMGMGGDLQQTGIESNIEQVRLQAEDESLVALQNLRKNLGTQAAIFAARGTRAGAGSAMSIVTDSIGNFNADERMRRMNLLGKTTALKGQSLLSKLGVAGEQSKLWQGFASRTVNRFSSSAEAYKTMGGFGGNGGTSTAAKIGSKARNFGLTQMG